VEYDRCRTLSKDNVVVQLRFMDGSLGTLTYVSNGSRQSGKETGRSLLRWTERDPRRLQAPRDGTTGRLRLAKTRTWSVDKGHLEECRSLSRQCAEELTSRFH